VSAAQLLALGVDPDRSTLFVQSHIPEHSQLSWVLQCLTGFGEAGRMTQFKDKASREGTDQASVGLFTYPVLQAADILLYKGDLVPVGQDQVQHIELARRIARSFNHRWGKVFPECEPLLTDLPKLLGLDGKKKMSKSLGNHIPLSVFTGPTADKQLKKLLGRAVTDEKRVTREDPGNPDDCNVGTMHKALSSAEDLAWVYQGCTTAGIGCVDCKAKLAANMTAHFAGYVERRAELLAAPGRVQQILEDGAAKARAIAARTMAEVRDKLGLWRSR
jgi:tryptophanyl-tRNA synthetase